MLAIIDNLLEFHKVFSLPIGKRPQLPKREIRALRQKLDYEEFNELMAAEIANDLVEIADAIADLIYVLVGHAVSYGIPLDEVWREVHQSNMSKAPGGIVHRRADGKILKPDNWRPPQIATILDCYAPRREK